LPTARSLEHMLSRLKQQSYSKFCVLLLLPLLL
jgi:hypothetical protein